MVICVGGVEGDEGVVGQAFDALCGLACDGIVDDLIHGHSSADAVLLGVIKGYEPVNLDPLAASALT